jgi:hypothetical protein
MVKKTIKRRPSKNKTVRKLAHNFEQEIVVKFLQILNMIKLYHWKTYSYATHKATDELYSKLNENVDDFIEVLLGKMYGNRINLINVHTISLVDLTSPEELKRELDNFKTYLISLDTYLFMKQMSNTDLYNIRDELLANINQFLYLLTFK